MGLVDATAGIKNCYCKVTTASVIQRKELFESLFSQCLHLEEFGENHCKLAAKIFSLTLHRYSDKKSRLYVLNALKSFVSEKGELAIKALVPELMKQGCDLARGSSSDTLASIALVLLKWTNIIAWNGYTLDNTVFGNLADLIKTQTAAVNVIVTSGSANLINKAYRVLRIFFEKFPEIVEIYLDQIKELTNTQIEAFCLVDLITRYLTEKRKGEKLTPYKDTLLQNLVKHTLTTKVKPDKQILVGSSTLIKQFSHADFKTVLLPVIQKALLRTPEVVIEAISLLIRLVSLDLSQYATEILKNLTAHLYSQNECIKAGALESVKYLAKQCSDSGAVEASLNHLFRVLSGADVKLTLADQRISILKAIEYFNSSALSGSSVLENLSTFVVTKISPFLAQEGHEGTLVQALKTLNAWGCHFSNQVPEGFFEVLKKGLAAKSATAVVRMWYLTVAGSVFSANTLHLAIPLIGLLTQHAEKCKSQGHQILVLGESLAACLILAKIATLDDVQQGNKMQNFFSFILDKSEVLTSDKFLITGANEALCLLLKLIDLLLRNHSATIHTEKRNAWYRALTILFFHPSWQVRKQAKDVLHHLFASSDIEEAEIQEAFLRTFREILKSQQGTGTCEQKETDHAISTHEFDFRSIPGAFFYRALVTLCKESSISDDAKKQLAFSVFSDAHHDKLCGNKSNTWLKVIRSLEMSPLAVVAELHHDVLDMIDQWSTIDKAQERALKTFLDIDHSVLLPIFVSNFRDLLKDSQISQVTQRDYNIMKCKDGDLYDKSIYDSFKNNETEFKNIKKESKAYSFKEQKMDLELREELKKKQALNTQVAETRSKLTKKQQEAIDSQLQEEKAIRDRLIKLDQRLEKHVTVLTTCVKTAPKAMRMFVPSLINDIKHLLRSPITAPHLKHLYMELRRVAFEEDYKHLGDLVAYASLRGQDPACEINPAWCEEELQEMATRAVDALYTFTTEQNVKLLMTYTFKRPFASFTFAYFLPLLEVVLLKQNSNILANEENKTKALQLVILHSKKRMSFDNEGQQVLEDDPELLPRAELLRILSIFIVNAEGNSKEIKMQKVAMSALHEVCKAGSGGEGCGFASNEEICILLGNLLSSSISLRQSSIEGLLYLIDTLPSKDDLPMWNLLSRRVLMSKFDAHEPITEIANRLWSEASLGTNSSVCFELLDDIIITYENVRKASGAALKVALSENIGLADEIITRLINIYNVKTEVPPPVVDSLGRVVKVPFVDPWEIRDGVATGFENISELIPADEVTRVFSFFVPTALGDRNEIVRKHMLDAALSVENHHGKDHMTDLLAVLEDFLDVAPDSSAHDTIRQSAVILLGSLAKHLDKKDPKIKPIFDKLIETLTTPSQQVQEAVANCLPPLCPAIRDEASDHVKELLKKLLESEKYGERRGAAYGLAGLVKGLGILALKQQNIIVTLTEAIQDKKVARHREGALFAFETLCGMLGRLFEPYVVHLLPHLLLCFGDGNQYVREAADETAKAVMRNLSAHGVKLILPSLLKALEEDSWRTKTGSVELLGAMAFCAPKQLSSCLPSIVPRLTEVLADSHMKVQKAGQQALKQIGGVIRNPEIQEISPIILGALADPASKTVPCLQALLNTAFVHFIDSPSLALIMPCLERALDQRSTETKKMAAQILGNMYALTDYKDLSPYLTAIVPGLKKSLLDPSPEVRAVSARALGAMVKGMGESGFNELLPWLLETLTSENSSVDRSGAAQGLAEVLHGLGIDRLDKLMPDVIATTSKAELAPHVREGYLMLYIYLPATFGESFVTYIGPIIPSILKGLADESEFVRETSLKAGQRIITMYADTAISLLLPELENGLFDNNWRIRYSSVQLLGDLLFRITGVTGKMTTEGGEDDNFGTSHSTKAIMGILGHDRRNRVLAGLYMGRSDVALLVRQASLHVWKVVVQNTARTLREILPTLFSLLLGCLASTSIDKRQIAARTLGDLVRKLGERILPEIIPILENGLETGEDDERQGVCIGLREIMGSTSREMVMQFEDSLILTIRKALLDDLPGVRAAAAEAFRKLFEMIDRKALEGVFPYVLAKLDEPEYAEKALDAIKQIISSRGKDVLSFLVPKLITPPVNTRALAILSSVAGDGLTRHIDRILPAMLSAMDNAYGTDLEDEAIKGTKTLVIAIEDDVGIRSIVDELIQATKNQSTGVRRGTASLLTTFCKDCMADYGQYVQQLMRAIVYLMNDAVEVVAEEAWAALGALIKRLEPAEQVQHISSLRQAIKFIKDDLKNGLLPGFCILKKGITPVLPMFREGILSGAQEVKEQAAYGLGEVVQITTAEALKPSVVNVTGPLIRILGDRFAWNVKVAILGTLSLLLEKVGIALKPFLPQLQTTFVKALNDPTAAVRLKAVHALKLLTLLHTRVDSLFTELRNGIKNNEENAIRETMLQALRGITLTAGKKMSEAVRKNILECLTVLLGSVEDGVRVASGGALGALFTVLTDGEIKALVEEQILDLSPTVDWTLRHGRTVALSYALFDTPDKVVENVGEDRVINAVVAQASADRAPICIYGVHSLGHLMMFNATRGVKCPGRILETMQKALVHSSNDVRKGALQTLRYVSRFTPAAVDIPNMLAILSGITVNYRDSNTAVKAVAESTTYFFLGIHLGDEKCQEALKIVSGDTAAVIQEICRASSGRLSRLKLETEDYPFSSGVSSEC